MSGRFWEFAHLTDSYKNMGWVDQVPRAGKLFVGGLHALNQRPDLFQKHGITHVLSVIDHDVSSMGSFKQYVHLLIQVEDEPNEVLLKYFVATNKFIESALERGEAVFVHCVMGKSRSATIICAFLMYKYRVTLPEALAQLCEGRPACEPNPGFIEQLQVYHTMLEAADDIKANEVYSKWEKTRFTGDWWNWENRKVPAKLI